MAPVSVRGGGSGTSCAPTNASPFGPHTDLEDSFINGATTFSGESTFWMGFIRNQTNGTVTVRPWLPGTGRRADK